MDEKVTRVPSDRMKELNRLLEKGVKEVFAGGGYTDYLSLLSRFPEYSYKTTLLVYLQNPRATRIAANQAWQALGRDINPGEEAIPVIVSEVRKWVKTAIYDQKTGNLLSRPTPRVTIVTDFKPDLVYDVSQTHGRELPGPPEPPALKAGEYGQFLELLESASPFPMLFEPLGRFCDGICNFARKKVLLRYDLPWELLVSTAMREVARAKLGYLSDRATTDILSESVAFVVCKRFGLDISHDFSYLWAWSREYEPEFLLEALDRIQTTAREILRRLEAAPVQRPPPSVLDRLEEAKSIAARQKKGKRGR